MVFSSPQFLFLYLPIFFILYYVILRSHRNIFIFLASLLFHFVDGGGLTIVLFASIVFNYLFGICIANRSPAVRTVFLIVGVSVNVFLLFYFKYFTFFVHIFGYQMDFSSISLPIGVSFFTFHAISYLIDIYWGKTTPAPSLIDFGMYMSNFPQLIAGPIVRYSEISRCVLNRIETPALISSGIARFVIGLGKKAILADNAGMVADQVFSLPTSTLASSLAWAGIFAYTMQIYFDFSGYSDMAIGLGRLMGFEFPQNFDQPYRSKSITEFWRRWHMTLSRWFRDYVYIPMGGNRHGVARTFFNLVFVFFLCGLWHGAAFGFIVWGLYHGLLLILERILRSRFDFVPSGVLGQAMTFLLVLVGWVFFRSPTLEVAVQYLQAMIGLSGAPADVPAYFVPDDKKFFLLISLLVALFPAEWLTDICKMAPGLLMDSVRWSMLALVGIYACATVAANDFNPFIYFRF